MSLLSYDPSMSLRPPAPPRAKQIPYAITVHGDTRQDPYHWLQDKKQAEVLAYLKAENAYTDAIMRSTKPLQKKLFEEMKGRIQETDQTVPEKWGEYYYYSRTVKGKQYAIECRRRGSMKANEEVLLDENILARGKSFCSVGGFELSPDQTRLAYAADFAGDERYTIFVKDLVTGKIIDQQVTGVNDNLAWAADNKTLFYTALDGAHRSYRVFRHLVGSPKAEDALIYEELDERFSVSIGTTKSQAYIVICSESGVTTECSLLDAHHPTEKARCFQPRKQNVEYQIAHQGDVFYILTNDHAKNFRLMCTSVQTPQRSYWKEVIPHSVDVTLESLDVFERFLVVYERQKGIRGISVLDLKGKRHRIALPEPVRDVRPKHLLDYRSSVMRFRYSSFVTPPSVYEYQMETRKLTLKKQNKIRGHHPANYRVERVWAKAGDGTRVPISFVCRKDVKLDGQNPCLLYGYGSYGICIDPGFSVHRLSLLDRGVVFAIAHVRGGADLGRGWYEQGKYQYKKNTFADFIACAEHLIAKKYTASSRLAIEGGSAGGLLMGAVINLRPELFFAVVAEVPFVDVLNTMLDPTLPLTVREYEEWGNPEKPTFYRTMKAYSPYDQVKSRAYPHLLVTAGLNDPRVSYWEPAKWVARLRERKTDTHRLLLKTEMTSGHGGPSGRYAYFQDVAFRYAFLFDLWGIKR